MASIQDFPELLAEWDFEKNSVSPAEVNRHSKHKFWWTCLQGHSRHLAPGNRSGPGCKACGSGKYLPETYPEVFAQWSTKNLNDGRATYASSKEEVWWICPKGHEWKAQVVNRTNKGTGCPGCSSRVSSAENNLADMYPEIAEQWDHSKNIKLPKDYTSKSSQSVFWLCADGHSWKTKIIHRTLGGSGCPTCSGLVACETTSLAAKFTNLLQEWDYEKNVDVDPQHVSAQANIQAWWKCKDGHSWQAWVYNRTGNGSGCPFCAGKHTKPEKAIEALFGVQRHNKAPPLSGLKYKPDLKLSETIFLNVDGLYWHQESKRGTVHHRNMRRAFEAYGLRIFQFYEDEVRDKPEIVKSIVDSALGLTKVRIFARKTNTEKLSAKDANEFLVANHLIGEARVCRYLSLTLNGKTVMVMAYKVHRSHVEIVRSAAQLGCIIVGGFQKLLSAVRSEHPGMPTKTLVDLRYADGHSLEKAGFVADKEYIQYQYTDTKIRKDKRSFRVKAGSDEKLEAAKLGWVRIFDAGRRSYVLL